MRIHGPSLINAGASSLGSRSVLMVVRNQVPAKHRGTSEELACWGFRGRPHRTCTIVPQAVLMNSAKNKRMCHGHAGLTPLAGFTDSCSCKLSGLSNLSPSSTSMEAVYDVQDDFPSMTDGFCFVACVCVCLHALHSVLSSPACCYSGLRATSPMKTWSGQAADGVSLVSW